MNIHLNIHLNIQKNKTYLLSVTLSRFKAYELFFSSKCLFKAHTIEYTPLGGYRSPVFFATSITNFDKQ